MLKCSNWVPNNEYLVASNSKYAHLPYYIVYNDQVMTYCSQKRNDQDVDRW